MRCGSARLNSRWKRKYDAVWIFRAWQIERRGRVKFWEKAPRLLMAQHGVEGLAVPKYRALTSGALC